MTEISLDDLACSRRSAFRVRIGKSGVKQESREKITRKREGKRTPSLFFLHTTLRAVLAI